MGTIAEPQTPTDARAAARPAMQSAPAYDIIFVGAGLANCLIALRLLDEAPDVNFLVLERADRIGGDTTWSFHETDVTADQEHWLRDLVVYRWPAQVVRYPSYERHLNVGYRTITAERMHDVMTAKLGDRLRLSTDVASVEADKVVLADGTLLESGNVIDGRGPGPMHGLSLGFQKFVGLVFETEEPHGETLPVIMDATVPQIDGYRFIYTLPFTPTRILIEDTYYSDTPDIDRSALEERITSYAHAKGWKIGQNVVHYERGVLPIVLGGEFEPNWREAGADITKSGLRAGLFHHTTSYSLPNAARLADEVAKVARRGELAALDTHLHTFAKRTWKGAWFYRMLNRLLFIGAGTPERYKILQRFYSLPEPLIQRFYAGQTSRRDMARILIGKPPIPITRAVSCLPERRAWEREQHHLRGISLP